MRTRTAKRLRERSTRKGGSYGMKRMPMARVDGWIRRRARRGLTIYFSIVVVLSALFEGIIISRPDIDGPFIAGLMWVPAIASWRRVSS